MKTISELGKFGTQTTFKFDNADEIWFTSDTHFGHANIMKYCQRPFANVEEMNEELIRRWNERVKSDNIVFHLGDFCFGGAPLWNSILNRLNGHIYLILGNHDLKNIKQGFMNRFEWVGFQLQIYVNNRLIYLNHYPFLCFAGTYRSREDATWQLFGHVHSRQHTLDENIEPGKDEIRLQHLFPNQYDVGVDNNNLYPVSFYEVEQIINKQYEDMIKIKLDNNENC